MILYLFSTASSSQDLERRLETFGTLTALDNFGKSTHSASHVDPLLSFYGEQNHNYLDCRFYISLIVLDFCTVVPGNGSEYHFSLIRLEDVRGTQCSDHDSTSERCCVYLK